MLKVQGQDFAKTLPENVPILNAYHKARTRDKKFHSMRYYWTKTLITDFLSKAITIAFTTIGIIYIVIQGSQDYTLLLMAFTNLVMFFCFGLISLSKTYDFFNNEHMGYVQEQLRLIYEEENKPKEAVQEVVDYTPIGEEMLRTTRNVLGGPPDGPIKIKFKEKKRNGNKTT